MGGLGPRIGVGMAAFSGSFRFFASACSRKHTVNVSHNLQAKYEHCAMRLTSSSMRSTDFAHDAACFQQLGNLVHFSVQPTLSSTIALIWLCKAGPDLV